MAVFAVVRSDLQGPTLSESSPVVKKIKSTLVLVVKLSLAAGLIVWMSKSGKLELDQLRILIDRPEIFALNLFLWIFVGLFLGTLRWRSLLKGMNIDVSLKRAMQLQAIGFFFNSAMPGAVGGDVIKAVYLLRESNSKKRTPAMMSIILDRVVGLFGLFTLAIFTTSFSFRSLYESPTMRPMLFFIYGFILVGIVLGTIVFFPHKEGADPVEKFLQKDFKVIRMLAKIYAALRSYRKRPRYLVYAWLISIVCQFFWFMFYVTLTEILSTGEVNVAALGAVFPIGILTTAIPVTPGGLGVGHVAFAKLYETIGLSSGATVFNIACLGQLGLNLLGIVPYLFSKSKISDIKQEELEFDDVPTTASGKTSG